MLETVFEFSALLLRSSSSSSSIFLKLRNLGLETRTWLSQLGVAFASALQKKRFFGMAKLLWMAEQTFRESNWKCNLMKEGERIFTSDVALNNSLWSRCAHSESGNGRYVYKWLRQSHGVQFFSVLRYCLPAWRPHWVQIRKSWESWEISHLVCQKYFHEI